MNKRGVNFRGGCTLHSFRTVLGKLGPGRLGPGKLGPAPIWRQIGPRTFWGPICHFLANRAPADWAPWRQIGPRQIGPRQIGPHGGKLGPRKFWVRQIGPRKILGAANWAPEILGAANWAPANRAPADWAPWRQIGPLENLSVAIWVPADWAPERVLTANPGPNCCFPLSLKIGTLNYKYGPKNAKKVPIALFPNHKGIQTL